MGATVTRVGKCILFDRQDSVRYLRYAIGTMQNGDQQVVVVFSSSV